MFQNDLQKKKTLFNARRDATLLDVLSESTPTPPQRALDATRYRRCAECPRHSARRRLYCGGAGAHYGDGRDSRPDVEIGPISGIDFGVASE
ncbi:Hypothetical protein CINCED_3A020725 [Cinara cedri]|uniref:Uncharacterized protein n=1 Tax=Cinara cedri TaxID=506608 RepID=A0A5E4MGZ7_9HEMI|nr:Hypothetical protein CINCED_3A020725 [Cinara cedri]